MATEELAVSPRGEGLNEPVVQTRTSWRAVIFRIALATFGLVMLVTIIQRVGADEVLEALSLTAPFLPITFTLEATRIGCDAWSTYLLLGERAKGISKLRLYLAHIVGHGVMNVFPAGRSASEAVKGTLLHRELGGPAAAVAMGTSNQANVLIASAIFSLGCAGAAFFVSTRPELPWAMVVHFVVLFLSGLGLRFAATHPRFVALIASKLPRIAAPLLRFSEHSRESSLFATGPIFAMFMGRLVQTLEYGTLAYAIGIRPGPLEALTVQGTNLVAAAVGVFMPGQVGSSEAIFAFAAEALGTTPARAMTIALSAHVSGMVWATTGLVLLALWRSREPAKA